MIEDASWRRDLISITLILCVLFGAFLGSRPLTVPDEGRYAEIPREMVTTGDYITPRINGIKYFEKPAFFYWTQSASIHVFGLNEWGVRIPNALFGLLGVLLTYSAARTLYGRRTGLLSAMVLSTACLYIGMTHLVTLDMTMATLMSGSLLCFLLGNQVPPGRKRNWFMWGMYTCAALAMLTKGLIAILLPGAIFFTWLLVTKRWRDLKTYCLTSGIALFLLIVLPWHIAVGLKNPEFFQFYFIDQQFLRYLTDSTDRNQPLWFLPLVLFGGMFPWTGFLIPSIAHSWERSPVTLYLFLWAGIMTVFFAFSNSLLAPYVLPIYTPLAILIGRYLSFAIDNPRHWGMWCGGLFFLVITLAVFVLIPIFFGLEHPLLNLSLGLLALTLIASFLLIWRFTLTQTLIGTMICFVAFYMSLKISYIQVESKSIKELALTLKPLLKDQTPVYSYEDYYQDLPVYLNQRITIVQFYGELKHGLAHTNTTNLWLEEEAFWQRWHQPSRQYMIMSLKHFERIKNDHMDIPLIEIARTKRNVLVTNREHNA